MFFEFEMFEKLPVPELVEGKCLKCYNPQKLFKPHKPYKPYKPYKPFKQFLNPSYSLFQTLQTSLVF